MLCQDLKLWVDQIKYKVMKDLFRVHVINGNVETGIDARIITVRFKLQMIINSDNHDFFQRHCACSDIVSSIQSFCKKLAII